MAHRKAKLTVLGRRLLVERVEQEGWPIAHAAAMAGVSRQTATKWVHRFRADGLAGLEDRSSAPRRSPRALPEADVQRIIETRMTLRVGPHRLAPVLGMPRSTIGEVLRRHGLSRLRDLDRASGVPIRYVRERPGELLHLDVKKLGRIPAGGGHRFPRPGRRHAASPGRLRLRPCRDRRRQPGRLRRRPGRRDGSDLRPIPRRGGGVVRPSGRPDRAGPDRQRQELHRVEGLAGLAAYALSRLRVPGASVVMLYLLVASTLPLQLFLVPLFYLWAQLGLISNLFGLAIIYVGTSAPFAVFLLRSYMVQIPIDFEDVARADGASDLQIFRYIIAPLSWPGFLTAGLVAALGVWSEYLLATVFLLDGSTFTVVTSFYRFTQKYSTDWALTSAGALIAAAPIVILFLLLQRRFIAGLTRGGLAGT